jgi:hypothetical protein
MQSIPTILDRAYRSSIDAWRFTVALQRAASVLEQRFRSVQDRPDPARVREHQDFPADRLDPELAGEKVRRVLAQRIAAFEISWK